MKKPPLESGLLLSSVTVVIVRSSIIMARFRVSLLPSAIAAVDRSAGAYHYSSTARQPHAVASIGRTGCKASKQNHY